MRKDIQRPPCEERKADLSENNSAKVQLKLYDVQLRDNKLKKVPLRIDERTVIMVLPCNCNKEYAEKTRYKYKQIK